MSPKNKDPKSELKAAVSALRGELKKAEKQIGKLTSKVGGLEAAKAELEKQVTKLTKKLGKAKKALDAEPFATVAAQPPQEPPGVYVEEASAAPAAPAALAATAPSTPDATWTVAQLRAEVTRRGLVGVGGRATKAQLLAVLKPAEV